MSKRVSLGKKVRFDVLKRDRFSCRYCGATAPDVLLHVDHIVPVKEGGTNDIENLVSACQSCNSGKGAVLLSVNATLDASRSQLESSQAEVEQLEMMLEWRKSLSDKRDSLMVDFFRIAERAEGKQLNYYQLSNYEDAAKKHGFQLAIDMLDDYIDTRRRREQYSAKDLTFSNFIAYKLNSDSLDGKRRYLHGIIRNRMSDSAAGTVSDWVNDNVADIDLAQHLIDSLRSFIPKPRKLNDDNALEWFHREIKRENGYCCDEHVFSFELMGDLSSEVLANE